MVYEPRAKVFFGLAVPRTFEVMLASRKVAVSLTLQSPLLFATTSADSTSANFLNSSAMDSALSRFIGKSILVRFSTVRSRRRHFSLRLPRKFGLAAAAFRVGFIVFRGLWVRENHHIPPHIQMQGSRHKRSRTGCGKATAN